MKKDFIKNNILILILFFLITFPAYSALLHPGMLTSHDGEGHIIRMFEFNNALDDGNFPVRWSKRLNWGLGYPFFNFNYPLVYYLSYLLNKIGLDLLSIFKIILLLSFPLSGFFSYLWLKQHFEKLAAFLGGLFYCLIPYHFLNVYVRGNIAETSALTIVPLGLYLVKKLYQKPTIKKAILLSFCISLIILTHNITALLFIPILFMYGLLLGLEKKYLKILILGFILPILTTSFFWLPALLTKQYIIIDQTFPLYYLKNFPNFKDLIYSSWGFGGSKTGVGQMSVQVGLLHLLVLTVSIIVALVGFKKILQKRLFLFFTSLSVFAFIMMLAISKPIWDVLKPIQYLQFPWRLLSVLALTSSFLSAYLLFFIAKIIPKKAIIILGIALVLALFFFNRNHWRANEYYDLPNYWFLDKPYHSTTTVDGEHTPRWQLENMPTQEARFELVFGNADIQNIVWKTNYHAFNIDAKTLSIILDRTVYFPGWSVFVDGKSVSNIDQNDIKIKGLIGFELTSGKHKVEVRLLETTINKVVDIISLGSLIILFGFMII